MTFGFDEAITVNLYFYLSTISFQARVVFVKCMSSCILCHYKAWLKSSCQERWFFFCTAKQVYSDGDSTAAWKCWLKWARWRQMEWSFFLSIYLLFMSVWLMMRLFWLLTCCLLNIMCKDLVEGDSHMSRTNEQYNIEKRGKLGNTMYLGNCEQYYVTIYLEWAYKLFYCQWLILRNSSPKY